MRFLFPLLLFVIQSLLNTAFALPVGHITIPFTDASRGNRVVTCEIFYPATAAGDDQPVYAPGGNEQYPVVVFGHGFLMPVTAYVYLQEALASEGFIVVFPSTESSLTPSHTEFAKDLGFAAGAMLALNNDNTSLFYQRVSNHVAVGGHSMGGGAAVLSFQYNPSFKTVFTLAAAETNPSASAAASFINIPSIFIIGTSDCITPAAAHQTPMYNAVTATCKYFISVTDATHCRFADYNLACSTGETFSGCNNGLDETTQHDIVLNWILPWLHLHLNNQSSAADNISSLEQNSNGVTVTKSCSNLSTTNPFLTHAVTTRMIDNGLYDVSVNDALSPYVTYTVFRADGMPVSGGTFANGTSRLSLRDFSPGVYVLACENSRIRLTRKLINLH